MQKLVIECSEERLITPSGLSLVGQMLGKSRFIKKCNNMTVEGKRSQSQIKNGDILLSYIGLLCQGKTSYEDIREMSADPDYYKMALGITRTIPSAETLRQRMEEIGSSLRKEILNANIEMFDTYEICPSALGSGFVPLDLDVTPMDNSKTCREGVSRTYKGVDGYAPMMAYVGTEGFLVNTKLREGSQHCQCHTPEFLRQTLNLSHQLTKKPLLLRMDAENDAVENLGLLIEDGSWFIVRRNLRRGESKQGWLHPVKRRRIRTVISNLIQIAGHLTPHGRRVVLALGRSNLWRQTFIEVYQRFALP